MSVRILIGDCRERLRELPDASVHCCVTSPPYFGLRDYGVAGQMGLEPTPDEFVAGMVEVFREVRRVLRDDGTLWLNIGDSYARLGGDQVAQTKWKVDGASATQGTNRHLITGSSDGAVGRGDRPGSRSAGNGLKQKDLIGIPWLLAFALRADGWYLRQDIIWSKPNPMPESVRDRCTKAHEYLFLLSKGPRYHFDHVAIRNAPSEALIQQVCDGYSGADTKDYAAGGAQSASGTKSRIIAKAREKLRGHEREHEGFRDKWDAMSREEQMALGSNKRSVWEVATQPFSEAHFATYPPALIEPCILAGCPENTCSKCGTALDKETVSRAKAGTNGNDLRPLSKGLQQATVENGSQPLLQSGLCVCGAETCDCSVRGVRPASGSGSQEQTTAVLQPGLCEQSNGAAASDDQGLDDHIEGLSLSSVAAAPERAEGRICAGASPCDGDPDREAPASLGSGSSQERRPSGQPTGEPGAADQGGARPASERPNRADNVSALQGEGAPVAPCPSCGADLTKIGAIAPGSVLDPFGGAGTTGLVADRLQRDAVLIELNPEYAEIARKRIASEAGMFGEVLAA